MLLELFQDWILMCFWQHNDLDVFSCSISVVYSEFLFLC